MIIRNFWIDADIDGRQTMLSGGPRSKNGGMDITIYQRDEGSIETAVRIRCREIGGRLVTEVTVKNEQGDMISRYETER